MPTILILHGWGLGAKNWNQVKELLKKQEYKVLIPDLPGFGKNPSPKKGWTINDYAGWVEKFASKNNLDSFFLIGHSFGGAIAIKFALRLPQKIEKLFLVSPAIIRKKTFKKEVIKKTAKIFSFLPIFIKKIVYRKIIKSDYPITDGAMRETYLKVVGENLLDKLGLVKVPTMIIWGEVDYITPIQDAYLIREKIENSQLKIFPRTGHNFHFEEPEKLVEIIVKAIKA